MSLPTVSSPESEFLLPTEPPITCRNLAPLGGQLGCEPEDFRVDEIPAYEPCGSGTHRYVRLRKRLLTTPELVHIVARAANVHESSVGTAGMKDKYAVTTQWLSLPMPCAPVSEWTIPETVEVLEESLHTNKLRTGHLHGNRFTIRLINLDIDAKARFLALWSRIERGILNSFGEQRFGHGGSNLQRAMDWLQGRFQLRGPKARFLKKLYPSVIQAEVFNRYLIRRMEASLDEPLPGEVVRLKGSGACFVVKNQADEKPRWHLGDILPTGPMIGAKAYPAAQSNALAMEQQVASDLGLEGELLARLNVEAPGTRRDLLLFLDGPTFEWLEDQSLSISFALPAGAYATQVLRELTQEPWLKSGRTKANPEIGLKAESDLGV